MESSPVIHLVTDAKGTVIHEVHVQMQELPLGMKALAPEVGAALPFDHTVLGLRNCLQQVQEFQLTPPWEAHGLWGELLRWHVQAGKLPGFEVKFRENDLEFSQGEQAAGSAP